MVGPNFRWQGQSKLLPHQILEKLAGDLPAKLALVRNPDQFGKVLEVEGQLVVKRPIQVSEIAPGLIDRLGGEAPHFAAQSCVDLADALLQACQQVVGAPVCGGSLELLPCRVGGEKPLDALPLGEGQSDSLQAGKQDRVADEEIGTGEGELRIKGWQKDPRLQQKSLTRVVRKSRPGVANVPDQGFHYLFCPSDVDRGCLQALWARKMASCEESGKQLGILPL